ncbi:MAG: hypothetical protein U5L96_21860 [Owenweeksia sp.]|nr:hypothetical protein [Owenweeksia sp.]
MVDFLSGNDGSNHAVREISELLLMLYDKHFEVIDRSSGHDDFYVDYLQQRAQTPTQAYSFDGEKFRIA